MEVLGENPVGEYNDAECWSEGLRIVLLLPS